MTPADLAKALAEHVDSVIPAILPEAVKIRAYWAVGSVDGEPGGSLYVHREGEKRGRWTDTAMDKYGDLLDLVREVRRLDVPGACRWAEHFLSIPDERRPKPKQQKQGDDGRAAALRLWYQTVPWGDRPYFAVRGVTIPIPPTIRYASLLYTPSGLVLPAAVCAISGPDHRAHAIQRIYLTVDCTRKAGVSQPRMSLGPMLDGAVRLAAAADVLGIAEGVEDALSAMQIHRVPCWAACGRRFHAIAIPESVTRLLIFADNDEPGITAAERGAEHHRHHGRAVEIIYPPAELKDWNAVLQAQRRERAA